MKTPRELETIQNWMQSVIAHPDGIATGIESPAARKHIAVSTDTIEGVISPSRNLSSIERLEVYGNAYFARLLECLREEFPAMVFALGEETFNGFAFGYLQDSPSTSYTLANLAKHFPEWLAKTRPEDDEPSPNWVDFLIDTARVERTYAEVFDGPGTEKMPALDPAQIARIPPEQWESIRLSAAPCVRLLELSFPVHEYITAAKSKADNVPVPDASPTFLVVTRRDYIVRRKPVDELQYRVLEHLLAGETLGEAIAANAPVDEQEFDTFAQDLRDWFHGWTADGYFTKIE